MAALSPDTQAWLLQGGDLLRIPCSAKVTASGVSPPTPDEQAKAFTGWLRAARLPPLLRLWGRRLLQSSLTPPTPQLTTAQELRNALFGLVGAHRCTAPGGEHLRMCRTVEDKDPGVLWAQSAEGALLRAVDQAKRCQARWAYVRLDHEAVTAFYRGLFDATVPRHLARGQTSFSAKSVPYAYCTLKAKCWTCSPDGRCVRTCGKPAHSCMRTIVPFYFWPARRLLQYVARGATLYVRDLWPGYELWSLSEVIQAVQRERAKLRQADEGKAGRCACCGQRMSHPGSVVLDAGQAYEELRTAYVDESVQSLFRQASAGGRPRHVVLERGPQCRGRVGGLRWPQQVGRVTLRATEIQRCLRAALLVRWFRLGDAYLVQKKGVPIGGPLSKALLSLVLCRLESSFDRFRWPELAAFFGLPGWTRAQAFMALRYVDDLWLWSWVLCDRCLEKLVGNIYRKEIAFERDDKGTWDVGPTRLQRWLDVLWESGWTTFRWAHHNPNERWVWSGTPELKGKHRLRPYDSDCSRGALQRLAAELAGRRARWAQLRLQGFALWYAVFLDIGEGLREGYTASLQLRVWRRQRAKGADWHAAEAYISVLAQNPSHDHSFAKLVQVLYSYADIASTLTH